MVGSSVCSEGSVIRLNRLVSENLAFITQGLTDFRLASYLGIYAVIIYAVIFFHIISELFYTFASLRASRNIHARLVNSLLGSTFR